MKCVNGHVTVKFKQIQRETHTVRFEWVIKKGYN